MVLRLRVVSSPSTVTRFTQPAEFELDVERQVLIGRHDHFVARERRQIRSGGWETE